MRFGRVLISAQVALSRGALAPAAATHHTVSQAILVQNGIFSHGIFSTQASVGAVPILTPLRGVSVHVVQPEAVRQESPDWRRYTLL